MQARVVHFEVPYDDHDRAAGFYRDIFGWEVQPMPGFDYDAITTGPSGDQGPTEPGYIGGGLFRREGRVNTPVIVLAVEDIDSALTQVEDAGGKTVQPREAVGEMGWAAYFTDCEGNLMGLWQSATGD